MKEYVVNLLKKVLDKNLKKEEIEDLIEIPPQQEMGDFAFPCFSLAKIEKKSPLLIAQEVAEKARKNLTKEISGVEIKSAYVNFFVDKRFLAKKVLKEAVKKSYGSSERGKEKKILIEFSQPNTHKAFHVGHIRGTSLGESLARILEFNSEKVVRANYSGDTGMHIAKWIWCYNKFHQNEKLKKDESWIANIYVDAVKRLVKDETFQEEVNEINLKIGTKEDKKINELWKKTRQLSIDSWKKIYDELDTSFDVHYFESEEEIPGKKIALDLLKKGIARESQGAVIVDLEKENLGIWVLLRSDKTVLYSSKDLALAIRKSKEFSPDRYLVCVGDEQLLHFKQLKKTLQLMKFDKGDFYDFITYGMVRLPTGKMSSRTGDNILYSEFMKELLEHISKSMKERGASKKEIDSRSLAIAISAIKYSMLKQDSKKTIVFDKKEALEFEGNTGPYLLYSYARASSILRKVKNKSKKFKILNLSPSEVNLIKKIQDFPEIVKKAYQELAPNLIANYAYELAQSFNEFYHAHQVIGSKEEGFRLKMIEAFRNVLKKSLNLLGIKELEEM